MGNALESMRKQCQDLMVKFADDAQKAALVQEVKKFEASLSAVEAKMIDLRNTGRSEDAFRQPVQLYERISWMIGQMVGTPQRPAGDERDGQTEWDRRDHHARAAGAGRRQPQRPLTEAWHAYSALRLRAALRSPGHGVTR
jgi:hypothetical protein